MLKRNAIISMICLSACSVGVFAKVKPDQIVKQYQSALGQLQNTEKKQRTILSELYLINRRLKQETAKRGELEKKRASLESRVRAAVKEFMSLQEIIDNERRKLIVRIRLMSTVGAKDFARVLLTSNSAAEIDRNLYMIGKIAENDLTLIASYRQNLEKLAQVKESLEAEKASFEEVVAQHDEVLKSLEQRQKERFALIRQIRKSKDTFLSRLRDYRYKVEGMLEEDRNQIADLILKPSFFESKGKLPHPVPGRATRIRLTEANDHRVALNAKGTVIQTQPGAQARAIFRAEVSYADFIPGYRGLVVLNHGDNYYSVIGNLDEILVVEGQSLNAGEVVGKVSPKLWRGYRGAYFEIRHFSEPEDPSEWLGHPIRVKLTKIEGEQEKRIRQ